MSTLHKYIKLANLLDDSGHHDAAKTIDNFIEKNADVVSMSAPIADIRQKLSSALEMLNSYETEMHYFDLHNAYKSVKNAEHLLGKLIEIHHKTASLELEMEKEVEVKEDEDDDDNEETETKKKKITLSFD